MEYPHRLKGLILAFVVFFIWGFTLLASTVAQETADPITFLMHRFVIAALIMLFPLIIGRRKLKMTRQKLLALLIIGLLEPVLYFPCEQYSLVYSSSSFVGIVLSMIPIVTMFLSALLLRERLTGLHWLFCLLSVAGVIALTVITGSDIGGVNVKGLLLSVGGVLCGSFYAIALKLLSPYADSYERSLGTIVIGAVFFSVWAIIKNRGELSALVRPLAVPSYLGAVMFVAVFASVIGYLALHRAYDYAPTSNVVVFCNLQTVVTVACGVVFLNETFSLQAGMIMLIILIGITGVQLCDNKPKA